MMVIFESKSVRLVRMSWWMDRLLNMSWSY